MSDNLLTPKGRHWLAVALAVLAVLLILVAIIVYFTTGDTATAAASAGTAAAIATAEALRGRQKNRQVVSEAEKDSIETADRIQDNAEEVFEDMEDVPTDVVNMTDEEKIEEGENLLGSGE